jgi:hypothetical protein
VDSYLGPLFVPLVFMSVFVSVLGLVEFLMYASLFHDCRFF